MNNSDIHRKRLLWAGFIAILAAGVGFGIRGGILDNWGGEYGFTGAQIGLIGGAGFTGFCFGIFGGGLVADKIGYRCLVLVALAAHIISFLVTMGANSPENAYTMLWLGMFIFSFANGTLEAVVNPLVATLFPENRNHYLNILHASWPLGMVLGTAVGWVLDDKLNVHWKVQLALYLIPTVIYGLMFLSQKMPRSEASEKGLPLGDMFKDVGLLGGAVACYFFAEFLEQEIPFPYPYIGYGIGVACYLAIGVITRFSVGSVLLFVLFITHALVGAVELGTDTWSQNITGNLFSSEAGKWLFIWTSSIMFGLRFCAHFIESKLKCSPVVMLFFCSVIASVGLMFASNMTTLAVAFGALGLYAIGKTFFWPTMLAVASDRFPRTGAIAISLMGGIGMMSAGIIGIPGLGYAKDRYTVEVLKEKDASIYEASKAEEPSKKFKVLGVEFEDVVGVDGKVLEKAKKAETRTSVQQAIVEADQEGSRRTLKVDAFIPAIMAVIYLGLMVYFKLRGGYKVVHLTDE